MIVFFLTIVSIFSDQIPEAALVPQNSSIRLFSLEDPTKIGSGNNEEIPVPLLFSSNQVTSFSKMFNECLQFISISKELPSVARNFTKTLESIGAEFLGYILTAIKDCPKKGFVEGLTCVHDTLIKIRALLYSISEKFQPEIHYISELKEELEICLNIQPQHNNVTLFYEKKK